MTHAGPRGRGLDLQVMTRFPGSHMTAFPALWSVFDDSTGGRRTRQPDGDPGDGTIISATNISIVTYAGDGLWCRQEGQQPAAIRESPP